MKRALIGKPDPAGQIVERRLVLLMRLNAAGQVVLPFANDVEIPHQRVDRVALGEQRRH